MTAGFVEDPVAFAQAAADIVAHTALLINTAYTGPEAAALLGINESRVRQRRLARTLWAIESDGNWLYPTIQFEVNLKTGKPDKQIRGLEQVFAALPAGLHPTAVAGLLRTPQTELQVDGRPLSIRGMAAQRRAGRPRSAVDRDWRLGQYVSGGWTLPDPPSAAELQTDRYSR